MTRPSETEQTFLIGQSWDSLYRDRYSYERAELLEEAVKAWRLNPLARRLTNLYKIYNVDGISFDCDHEPSKKFLDEFWTHDLNQMDDMLEEISNEIFLTGNLFPLFSVDQAGMTFVRIFPSDQIDDIKTAPNDLRQEMNYITKQLGLDIDSRIFPNPHFATANAPIFMEHFAINKLAGTVWGEGEIWPDLPWLSRYATWLEDRVRLNHFRSAFMYIVTGEFTNEEEKQKLQSKLNANPPRPGTVKVVDEKEDWAILSANLDAFDASVDGIAIKKMIAVNHVPMHYLAEPEGGTRTTADAAGTPTFKGFENHQNTFIKIVKHILTTALKQRALKDSTVKADALITITSADATERDNAALALATSQIVTAIGEIYDRKLIDEPEYMRLVYRFAGEVIPPDVDVKRKGIRRQINKPEPTAPTANAAPSDPTAGSIKTDAVTGDTTVKEPTV